MTVITLTREEVAAAAALGAATLHEAGGKIGALPAGIRPVDPAMRVAGPALPVRCPPGDNLWLHRAIYRARPGDVLVCDVGAAPEHGYWGEVMAVAAQERGIAGLVINGGVRDTGQLRARGFATFCGLACVRGTTKRPDSAGTAGAPVHLGCVQVAHGDLVVGDADGVVVLPRADAAAVVAAGRERERQERSILARLAAGDSTIEIYDLPREASS